MSFFFTSKSTGHRSPLLCKDMNKSRGKNDDGNSNGMADKQKPLVEPARSGQKPKTQTSFQIKEYKGCISK